MKPRHWRHRPPWWPDTEPWPPTDTDTRAWHTTRRRYVGFALGCFALLLLVLGGGIPLVVWLTATVLGTAPSAFPSGFSMRPFIFAALGLGIPALILLFRSVGRAVVPLADLTTAASRVAQGDYSGRVQEYGPREVRALARAFNTMSERLEATAEQRRGLLAEMTHELRTPLTVIQGNLEAIIDGVYPADEAHLGVLLEETRRLSRRIDDLRTLALTDTGALVLQKAPVDITLLINETAAAFRAQAQLAGIDLNVETDPGAPILQIDAARVREVLENLLVNALRYTSRGREITVRVSHTPAQVAIAVEDTGTGIASERLPHIFDRFSKAPDSRGMGLGLAIARDLVRAHGGDINATSTLGQGTTIQIQLPAG